MACSVALMESPVCLIENTDGRFSVCPAAIDILMGITQPAVVVAVVGLYRTGKSYLMNKLAGKKQGFALGATIQSKTKGIWMWALPHPIKVGHTLVLLDTEGLGDVEKGDQKNDAWIFALAILLSSTLVYNSRGTIDNQAIENLQYVTELTERIKVKSPSGGSSAENDEDGADVQFVEFFPSFVWAVRDFTLELKIDEKDMTDDQYLEHALSLKPGKDRRSAEHNLPRECIRYYFPTRRCFVFVTPTSTENMPHLESMDERDLSPSFRDVTSRFCSYIFKESLVKTVKGGIPVTGRRLGHLAKTYVDTIARGDVPCLENAVLAMAQIENEQAVKDALNEYQKGMQELHFPMGINELSNQHRHWDTLATKAFMSRSFKDDGGEHLKALAEAIAKHYADLLGQNEDASEDRCRQLLSDLSAPMIKKLQEGFYAKPGGYELYCGDSDSIVAQFRSEPNKGVRAEEVLEQFLNDKSRESKSILQADNKLSEQDRKIHEEKQRAAMLEQEKRKQTEQREQAEKILKDQEENHQETLRQLKAKKEQEAAEAQKEMERALNSKLQEQELLMKKGFQRKKEAMGKEIQNLREEMEMAMQREKAEHQGLLRAITEVLGHGFQSYMDFRKTRESRKRLVEKNKYNRNNAAVARGYGSSSSLSQGRDYSTYPISSSSSNYPSPLSQPAPSSLSLPAPSPLSVPAPSPLSLPAPSPLSLPAPSSLSLPASSPLSLPAPSPLSLPAPSPLSLPAPSPLSLPAPSSLSLPTPSPLSPPAPSSLSLPAPSPLSLPAPSPLSLPAPSSLSLPASSPLSLPAPSPLSLPAPSPLSLPAPSPLSLPAPSPLSLPAPSPLSLPAPSPLSLPAPSSLSLPAPSRLSLPAPSPLSLPAPSPPSLPEKKL